MSSKIFSADTILRDDMYNSIKVIPQQMPGTRQMPGAGRTYFVNLPQCNNCIQRCLPGCTGLDCGRKCEEKCRAAGYC